MSNERSNKVMDVSMNSSRCGSDMDVDAPKSLNNIENSCNSKSNSRGKKSEIGDEHHFQN